MLRQIFESFRMAWQALRVNVLRTTLSLLSVSVGIFTIILVLSVVDSLERSIKESFSFLGSDQISIQKWPYGLGGEYPWWKYLRRPEATYDEYQFLRSNLTHARGITIFAIKGNPTLRYKNNSTSSGAVLGISEGHDDVYDFKIGDGRFFSALELEAGRPVVLIGVDIKDELFGGSQAIGNQIKIKGLKYTVIGILAEAGESIFGDALPSDDRTVFMPFKTFSKLYYTGDRRGLSTIITLKGMENDPGLLELENEARGLMRQVRGLRPTEEDNFAMNRPEALLKAIGGVFSVLTFAGAVIGGFAILVGGFGIANIMFVSVKERTNIIGIEKAAGAKNYFILLQFLFESIFLSVIGGILGLILVYLATLIPLGTFDIVLGFANVLIGLIIASVTGIISGIVPASMAARLDPVIAIRSS